MTDKDLIEIMEQTVINEINTNRTSADMPASWVYEIALKGIKDAGFSVVPVKRMRIMGHPIGCPEYIPFSILSEQWAKNNHQQTLDRLNERGGLCVYEALAIIERRDCYNIPDETATDILNKHLKAMIKAGDVR